MQTTSKSNLNKAQKAIALASAKIKTWKANGKTIRREMDALTRLMLASDAAQQFGIQLGIVGVIDSYGAVHLKCYNGACEPAPWHAEEWPHIYHKHWRITASRGKIETISWTPDADERDKIEQKSFTAGYNYILNKLK